MQTLTIQITDNNGLKALYALEDKHFIRIVDDSNIDAPSLPGKALSIAAFKSWINQAEDASAIDLKTARGKWAAKKKRLQKLIK